MLDDLRSMAVFAAVVREGSFRRAGEQLQLSPSVVSHHVARLEKRVGCALLYRTTRKLSLTADGNAFYEACARAVEAADEGLNRLHARQETLMGRLRIGAPALMAQGPFVADVHAFSVEYPGVEIELLFSDERRNQIEDGFDVAIRVGWLEDSGLRAKKLLEVGRVICASAALLENYPEINEPHDLQQLPWIRALGLPSFIDFTNPAGEIRRIVCSSRIKVNSAAAARDLAESGAGAIETLEFFVRSQFRAGSLRPLLPGWQIPSAGLYAVWPNNVAKGALAQRFVAFLQKRLNAADHVRPQAKSNSSKR